ncbi:MAG: hypothetical protein ACYSUX_04055 [Planctomycetota bacterium]|jgi:hypothetical protein
MKIDIKDLYDKIQKKKEKGVLLNVTNIKVEDQLGQCCGLYAMAWGMCYLQNITSLNSLIYPVRKHYNKKSKQRSMRDIAKNIMKKSAIGEIFKGDDMVELGKHIGLSTKKEVVTTQSGFDTTIKENIDKGRPIIVPFAVSDTTEEAINDTGGDAHWCIAFGYVEKVGGGRWIIVTHWGTWYKYDSAILFSSTRSIKDHEYGAFRKIKKTIQNPSKSIPYQTSEKRKDYLPFDKDKDKSLHIPIKDGWYYDETVIKRNIPKLIASDFAGNMIVITTPRLPSKAGRKSV